MYREVRGTMKKNWKDEDIDKGLEDKWPKATPEEIVFDRVWFKIEDRLAAPKKHFWNISFGGPGGIRCAGLLWLAFAWVLPGLFITAFPPPMIRM